MLISMKSAQQIIGVLADNFHLAKAYFTLPKPILPRQCWFYLSNTDLSCQNSYAPFQSSIYVTNWYIKSDLSLYDDKGWGMIYFHFFSTCRFSGIISEWKNALKTIYIINDIVYILNNFSNTMQLFSWQKTMQISVVLFDSKYFNFCNCFYCGFFHDMIILKNSFGRTKSLNVIN